MMNSNKELRLLKEEKLKRLQKKKFPQGTKTNIEWQPFANTPQEQAYTCEADELFYGGAAGGGKTDLALGLAVTKHRKSLILRREYPQLRGIIERSKEIVGDSGRLNENTGFWRLNDGRTIELGGCQHDKDKTKYQGRPHDLIVFDEASEFLESQVQFITGWARSASKQRVRIVLAGNPPMTPEGLWILKRYAAWLDPAHQNPAQPGELRYYAMVDGEEVERPDGIAFDHNGELIQPKSRTFIPAKVQDNPYLMASGYESQLQSLPEPLRSQLLYGDFNATSADDPYQVIPSAWLKAAMDRWQERDICEWDGLGCDVARGGKDKTVIAPRCGAYFGRLIKYPGHFTPDGPSAAALITQHATNNTRINVDVAGIGGSVYDSIVAHNKYMCYGINNASGVSATDKSGKLKLVNKRSELYWKLREALDPKTGDNLIIPNDMELFADLTAAHWKLTVRGIQIELKEDIIKRIGRSPDCGDALTLALDTYQIGFINLDSIQITEEELIEEETMWTAL